MRETSHPPSQLISAETLGKLLSLSKRQIFRLNSLEKIPKPIKVDSRLHWQYQEISDWVSSNCPDRKLWEKMKMQQNSKKEVR